MSKVQTFEEWMDASPWDYALRDVMLSVWQAAHENAARVCEAPMSDVLLQVGEMPRQSIRDGRAILDGRAAAIREAAK